MVIRINNWFDVNSSEHVLNGYDTTEMWTSSQKSVTAYYLWYPLRLISKNFAEVNHF